MELSATVLLICVAIAMLCRIFFGANRGSSSADWESGGWGDGGGD